MLLGAMLSATAAATDGNNEFVDDMMLADQQAQMDAEQLDFEELELEDELEKEYYTTMPVQEGNGAVMSVAEELDFEESEWEDGLEKEFTTMPVQEDNGVVMPAVAEEDILTFDDFIMTVEDDVLPRGDAEDYEDVQDYATAIGGTQKEEQQQQEETNNNEEEGDKPNDVEAPRPEVEDNIAEESQQEEAQKDVVPRPELQDNIVQEDQQGESQPRGVDVDEEGEVASDSTQVEEIDVEEAAQDLLKEAEEEEETQKKQQSNQTTPALTSANEIPANDNQQRYHPSSHKSARLAHGAIGALVFGLLLPISISSAYFRDAIPAYWIYLHVSTNVMSFVLTFLSVGVAFATMHGMDDAGEGHMKEMHHLAGLLLLMLVSFQTANGFLRPPREFVTDDEHDRTPGAVLRSSMNDKGLTARTLWHLVHSALGLFVHIRTGGVSGSKWIGIIFETIRNAGLGTGLRWIHWLVRDGGDFR